MHPLQRTSLFVISVLLAVTACVIPSVTITDPVAQATIIAATVDAAVRGTAQAAPACQACLTEVAPSATATATATASPTASPSPTVTATITASPTLGVISSPTSAMVMISVSVPTNCRSGPGKAFPIEGALLVGEEAEVLGRDPTGDYWYIPNPDQPGDFCYVWGQYATFTGFAGAVPVLTPPPTPLPTLTPTPSPGFGISYEGLVGCSGTWWTRMEIENTGSLTYRSMEFILIDLDLDTEDADESDGFVDRSNCSSSTSKVSLGPGDSLIVSSPNLSNDPDNHNMRARIKLCSQTGLSGECVTKTFNFKP